MHRRQCKCSGGKRHAELIATRARVEAAPTWREATSPPLILPHSHHHPDFFQQRLVVSDKIQNTRFYIFYQWSAVGCTLLCLAFIAQNLMVDSLTSLHVVINPSFSLLHSTRGGAIPQFVFPSIVNGQLSGFHEQLLQIMLLLTFMYVSFDGIYYFYNQEKRGKLFPF